MPVWLVAALSGVAGVAGKVAVSLFTSLLTEAFLKKAVIIGLEKLVAKTETDADNQLLDAAKKAWEVQ